MATGPRKKLKKSIRKAPKPLEDEVAQALYDLEVNNTSLRPVLQKLYLNTAKEIEVSPTLRAVVIFVPLRFLVKFHKIQKTLITELEKKFSGKQVFILAQRKIARKTSRAIGLVPGVHVHEVPTRRVSFHEIEQRRAYPGVLLFVAYEHCCPRQRYCTFRSELAV